jgi:pimeloyl-ACP methyl ester carboxylesterase
MATFVLVHGSWHGAWCWFKLLPTLRDAGHEAVAPELPAHGISEVAASEVTFEDYVDLVSAVVENASESVVLVGHSMGGHVITQTAERCADRLDAVVYLAAFLPPDGQSLTDLDVSAFDSVVPDYVTADTEAGVVRFDAAGAREAFYHDCSPADVALGRSLLRPEPIEPRTTPVDLTADRYGEVPRVYVETVADRALPVAFQRSMREAVSCGTVRSLGTGHSPFLSAPGALAETLLDVGENSPERST